MADHSALSIDQSAASHMTSEKKDMSQMQASFTNEQVTNQNHFEAEFDTTIEQ